MIIDSQCEPIFAKAIEKFYYKAENYNFHLGKKENSIFVLVKKYLDRPFKRSYLRKNFSHFPTNGFLPSFMATLPPSGSLSMAEETLFGYERAKSILDKWDLELEFFERTAEESWNIGGILTLRNLINYISKFKPEEQSLPFKKNSSEKTRTKAINKKRNGYCELCWRKSKLAETMDLGIFATEWHPSARFCGEHTPRNGENTRYRVDHKLKETMKNELASMLSPSKSTFLPNFTWFANYFPGLSENERRKIAYDLVHSKLNSKKSKSLRKEILIRLSKGQSTKVISEELEPNVSVSSVNRHKKTIIEAIQEVLKFPFLNEDGTTYKGDPHARRFNSCTTLLRNSRSLYDTDLKTIQRCDNIFPRTPELADILEAIKL
ncbi:MAG: hypothetical protein ACI9SP_003278 [Arenicella sp.]|jgi:hypothetical protein